MIDRRARIRKGLHPLYIPFYDALCAKLGEDWQPCQGYRTFPSQDALYAQGRTAPGGIATKAKSGESPHNYGMATDWCRWSPEGIPSWPDPEEPIWKEFIDAVTAVGLRPGSEFGDVDHCELRISVPWSTIRTIFFDHGQDAAVASIKAAMTVPGGAP